MHAEFRARSQAPAWERTSLGGSSLLLRPRSQSHDWERTCLRISDSQPAASGVSHRISATPPTCVAHLANPSLSRNLRVSNQRFTDTGIPNQRLGTSTKGGYQRRHVLVNSASPERLEAASTTCGATHHHLCDKAVPTLASPIPHESGRGLPHSKTLSRLPSSCRLRFNFHQPNNIL